MPRDPHLHSGVPRELILAIKSLAADGKRTKDIAHFVGLSVSTVHKIRQGYYDHRLERDYEAPAAHALRIWCPTCRAHVFAPCQLCEALKHQRRERSRPRDKRPSVDPRTIHHPRLRARLALPVGSIGLFSRVANTLELYRYHTVGQLLAAEQADLQKLPNISTKTIAHILQVVGRLGFRNPPSRANSPPKRKAA